MKSSDAVRSKENPISENAVLPWAGIYKLWAPDRRRRFIAAL
jgi:hypothetical protein